MMGETMDPFVAGDLTVEVDDAADAVRLGWRGKSNARNPAQVLAPLFAEVLPRAGERGVPLEMHFEKLEHFNSSTIAAVIQLIHQSRAKGVKLVLVFDPTVKWQKLSFESLRILGKADGLLELRPA